MFWKLLSVAIGGAFGAILRFAVSHFSGKNSVSIFPWGTLIANLTGAFLIGLFWGFFENAKVSQHIKSFVIIGIIGSFTTFSTLSLETVKLFQQGYNKLGLINIAVTNILGILLVIAGFFASGQINFLLSNK